MKYLISIANVKARSKEGEVLSFDEFKPLSLHSSIEEARRFCEKYYKLFAKKEYPVLLRIDEVGREFDYMDVELRRRKENEQIAE